MAKTPLKFLHTFQKLLAKNPDRLKNINHKSNISVNHLDDLSCYLVNFF
jgi:hypothetical protein